MYQYLIPIRLFTEIFVRGDQEKGRKGQRHVYGIDSLIPFRFQTAADRLVSSLSYIQGLTPADFLNMVAKVIICIYTMIKRNLILIV